MCDFSGKGPQDGVHVSGLGVIAEFGRANVGIVVRTSLDVGSGFWLPIESSGGGVLHSFPGGGPWFLSGGDFSFDEIDAFLTV